MPTLVNIKPSSLITLYKKYIPNNTEFFMLLEKNLKLFHCNYEILYESKTAYFILIYSPKLLDKVLYASRENTLLCTNGYSYKERLLESNLQQLKIRYKESNLKASEFPHEIGIFLGYPIKDVEGFIKNKGEDYIFCGYWKVYHNPEEASNTFRRYRELRQHALIEYFN
jgi:hypothetical protein